MPIRTRPAIRRIGDPRQERTALPDAVEHEARTRRMYPFSDGDGEHSSLVCPVGISRHPHRLGRKPRHVQIVGLPSSGSQVELVKLTKDEVWIGNTGAFTVTLSVWIY